MADQTPDPLAIAERIARSAHAGQKDTVSGEPYIGHVERVVARVDTPDAKAVAWLHDVLEDSPQWTAERLTGEGIPWHIVKSVGLLTRRPPYGYAEYIAAVIASGDVLARTVKVADLLDHLTPTCPPRLADRYRLALSLFEATAARDAERQQHQQTIQQQAAQIETLTQALAEARQWTELLTRGKSPCGHWSAHAMTECGGKLITCLHCERDALYAEKVLADARIAALAGASRPTEGEQGRLGNYYGRRLTASVDDGQVVVSIGVQTLAHAVAYADWANPFDEAADDYIRTFAIADAGQFAKDVVNAMLAEREDGSTPLSDFLDKMSQAAIEDGSLGLHEDEHRIKHGETAPCETWAEGEQGAPQ